MTEQQEFEPLSIDIEKYFKMGREYGEALIAIGGTLTEDVNQFNYECDLTQMYLDWKRSLPKLEEAQWLNIFPQAKKRYGKLIKGQLKIERKYLYRRLEAIKQEAIKRIQENTPDNAWRDALIKEWRDRELQKCEKRIRTIGALLQLITQRKDKPVNSAKIIITPDMIQRAKEYPLDKLVEIKRGFTRCFGHDDQKPSAYCKNNFIHCFVCQKQWDTIAVLMERDGLTFKQAVLQLQ